jgi:phosphoribosyl 1,2-cyclic phosphodiesterase/DNA-binding NarL/FixJ family response regulator
MKVKFWGVRGSLAKPGPTTVCYGGNTACIQITPDSGQLIILDSGTGIHTLGHELLASGKKPLIGSLLITHTHWDHIQGFPFFVPLFVPGNEWVIYGPGGMGYQLSNTLSGQMSYNYFPVTLESLAGTVRFTDLGEGTFNLDDVQVSTCYTNHPSLTLGYRLEVGSASVVYIPDHEPHSLHPMNSPVGAFPVHHEDQDHIRFIEDADLLIHDAQYTLDEYPDKIGWGHSPFEKVVDYAVAAGVKRLALFHHDPLRDDDALERLVEAARKRAAGADHVPEIFAAADDMVIELIEDPEITAPPVPPAESALITASMADHDKRVLIVDDDRQMVRLLEASLEVEEDIMFMHAYDGESAVEIASKEHPDLILLDLELPEMHGLDVCRALRSHPDIRVNDVVIIAVTGKRFEEADVLQCFEAGATDYITKQFAASGLRQRVRGWLMRTSATAADRRRGFRRRSRGRRKSDSGRRLEDND